MYKKTIFFILIFLCGSNNPGYSLRFIHKFKTPWWAWASLGLMGAPITSLVGLTAYCDLWMWKTFSAHLNDPTDGTIARRYTTYIAAHNQARNNFFIHAAVGASTFALSVYSAVKCVDALYEALGLNIS